MSDPKEFLSRWSRLKREADQATPEENDRAAEPRTTYPAPSPDPELPTPELPPIESLNAASDFKPFLAAGVPEQLKLAALRRLWSIDPEIRDFVGPARDYGWDWNTPGGVPGSGPLPSADEIARAVERIFGVDEPTEAARKTPKARELNTLREEALGQLGSPEAVSETSQDEPRSVPPDGKSGQGVEQEPTIKPRHGSATPV